MDTIRIDNLKIYAYHGVLEEEKQTGQYFYISMEMKLDLSRAAAEDRLDRSVDYAAVARLTDETVRAEVYDTIEAVAESVVQAVMASFTQIRSITVKVSKPEAPIGLEFENVSCTLSRSRHTVYLSIGSNIGDRERYLDYAVSELRRDSMIEVKKVSSYINTEPYGPVEQPDFLNGALEIETLLSPEELLSVIQDIELEAGRERVVHWGPRTLDIDILLYDDAVISQENLRIPHPEMHKRYFVLKPLNEIAPYAYHPILKQTVGDMRTAMHLARKEAPERYSTAEYTELSSVVDRSYSGGRPMVCYAGVPGAYAEEAAIKYFGGDADYINVKTFDDIISTVMDGSADYGVIPVENSSAGFVSGNLDVIRSGGATIIAETEIDINHCLLGLPEAELSDIRKVYSHQQGLMQCKEYIEEHGFSTEAVSNTAKAAKQVMKSGDITHGAVASERAAEIYGLKVLDRGINFSDENSTRFLVIAKDKLYLSNSVNVSICFTTQHKVGALYDVMGIINDNMLNMTSIESRPSLIRKWEYWFYVTFEGKLTDRNVTKALGELRANTDEMHVLGTF